MVGAVKEPWCLLAAGAQAVEGNPKGPAILRPEKKTIYKKKPKAINVDKNCRHPDGRAQVRVEADLPADR